MSQWSKINVIVKNTELFKTCCEKHGVAFNLNKDSQLQVQGMPVYGILQDQQETSHHSTAYLCAKANEQYQLVIDNDPNWCSITKRVGANGGLILRDYAEGIIRNSIRMKGGMVQSVNEQKDKSLLMKVMVP
jgi:hypothetical protein